MSAYASFAKSTRVGKIDPGRGQSLASVDVLYPHQAAVCPTMVPSRPEGVAESVYPDYMNLCHPDHMNWYDLETDLQRHPDIETPLRGERVSMLNGDYIAGTVQTEGQNKIVKHKPAAGQFQNFKNAFVSGNRQNDAHYF